MKLEDSREIERMFLQEVREKKIIGSNVHKRTGIGRRGGVKGGVRFAKNHFKKYEKNSKVVKMNLFEEIVPYEEFIQLEEDLQIKTLIEWRKRFSNKQIREGLEISASRYNNLIKDLNIESIEKEVLRLTDEEMQEAKKEIIPYYEFKSLPNDQKYELIDYYMVHLGMKTKDIVKAWDGAITENTLSSQKSSWKRAYVEKLEEKEDVVMNKNRAENIVSDNEQSKNSDLVYLLGGNPSSISNHDGTEEDVSDVDESVDNFDEDVKEDENYDDKSSQEHRLDRSIDENHEVISENLHITASGKYRGYDLKYKIRNLIEMMNDLNDYEIFLVIREVGGSNEIGRKD